ncbi:hypothetical protein, partial [Thiolapillus sp.]|uniref:hypothetical protein n=1 Tax=Thiolapillus sp. TaxID=2017437 RepID=UPI003AF6153C
ASAIKSGLPMPFTSISAGWIFTLMGLLDDGRPLNQGKSQEIKPHFVRSLHPNRGIVPVRYIEIVPTNLVPFGSGQIH